MLEKIRGLSCKGFVRGFWLKTILSTFLVAFFFSASASGTSLDQLCRGVLQTWILWTGNHAEKKEVWRARLQKSLFDLRNQLLQSDWQDRAFEQSESRQLLKAWESVFVNAGAYGEDLQVESIDPMTGRMIQAQISGRLLQKNRDLILKQIRGLVKASNRDKDWTVGKSFDVLAHFERRYPGDEMLNHREKVEAFIPLISAAPLGFWTLKHRQWHLENFELFESLRMIEARLKDQSSRVFQTMGSTLQRQRDEEYFSFVDAIGASSEERGEPYRIDLVRIRYLSKKFRQGRVWNQLVHHLVDYAREKFKDLEPQESSARELLKSLVPLDERFDPERVFRNLGGAIFETPPSAPPSSSAATVDLDPAKVASVQSGYRPSPRQLEEIKADLEKMYQIPLPRGVRAKAKGDSVKAFLSLVGFESQSLQPQDFFKLKQEDFVEYQRAKTWIKNFLESQYPRYLRDAFKQEQMYSVIRAIESVVGDDLSFPNHFE